jgi:hypothetical protein
MENQKDVAQDPGSVQSPPPYPGAALPRKDYFREDPRLKSPALAAVLSLMPGLGQIYIGYYQQGFINILVIASIISLLSRGENFLTPFLALFLAFYWLYNMVDAARKATFYNQVLSGIGSSQMPEGEVLPGARGSLLGGAVMIVVGGIALAHTRFGMPLDWIERWWPLALVLLGAYLLIQSYIARKPK